MKNNWKKYKLGDIAKIESGGTPSSKNSSYWNNGDVYWVTLPDLSKKYITDTQRKITKLGLKKSSAKLLPVGTVIFSSRATIGQVSIAQVETSTNQGSKNFVCDSYQIFNEFLYYLLISQTENIKKLAGGATYKEINKTTLENFEVEIPDIKLQKTIANILCNYDDLIENNTKRIKILEEMAQSLYEEWFINFKFPGHETIKLVDSELGKIPEEWRIFDSSNVIDFDPKTKVDKNIENKYLPMGSISELSMIISDIETRKGNSGSKFQNKDTLLARISPSLENGKTGFVNFLNDDETAFGSTEFIVMRSKLVCPEFVYCLARSSKFRNVAIKSMRGATGRQRVQRDALEIFKIALPNDLDLIRKFHSITEPIFNQIFVLNKKNKILSNLRDLLLPKLISGEIEV